MQKFAFIALLSFLFIFQACTEDDDSITVPSDTNNPTNPNGDNNSNDNPNPVTVSLNLPAIPFNYADPDLPNYFNRNNVQDQDNTPNNNPITDHGATLGRVLFYDVNLSANNTISCASCHLQENGFSDPEALSIGFEGQRTGRNSMGLSNARFYERGSFFWDERAASLEAQVLLPIQDHIEMGMDLDALENKLDEIEYYVPLLTNAFGDEEITSNRIALALAQFVRSIVSYESKFDAGLQLINNDQDFDDEPFPNFTASENLGKALFFSNRTNCDNCHGSINFVGNVPRNNGLDLVYTDNGIGEISGRAQDNGAFKVNSLRNIELTAPYMHDGRFATLEEVIEHYNSGVQAHPNLSPQLRQGGGGGPGNNNEQPRRLNLNDQEKIALVDFLKTLTDFSFIQEEKYANPFIN